ncbi:MAG TPA: glycerate kinase [Tepidisphaeraceae bacterium]|jgi:glycerate kinase|nr:glycerate kinase [Tepidisphaeraceae bacterium]
MRILIAPDKFKGSLSAVEVADAIARGVGRAVASATVDRCPIADGGEGTVAALVSAMGGRLISERVTGPLPEMKVDAVFGLLPNDVAVVEMAAASGLALLPPSDRDPMATTTFGTGELLAAAARRGAKKVILGIGGSATIDAGIGCAQAAGLTVLLADGEPVHDTEPLCGRDLERVVLIKHGRGGAVDRLTIEVACDVTNPLLGPDGAAAVYGPQKGASATDVQWFDEKLRQLATRTGKLDIAGRPGAGAAGGLGFAMMAYFNASLRPGIELVLEACRFHGRLAGVDLCITGEGGLDGQTASGKAVHGVAAACKTAGVPCIAIAGSLGEGHERLRDVGITRIISLVDESTDVATAMRDAAALVERRAETAVAAFVGDRSRGSK